MLALKQYVPLIGALGYLVYVGAAAYTTGDTSQIPAAVGAVLAALGYGSAASAHAKIDRI